MNGGRKGMELGEVPEQGILRREGIVEWLRDWSKKERRKWNMDEEKVGEE